MAPPHTHPSTPSQTPNTLQRVNAALQKEKAEWQKSIAEQEARIAGLRKEKERLEKLEQSGALVFPATATSEELVVTDPKIIQMVHDHIIRDKKLIDERLGGSQS